MAILATVVAMGFGSKRAKPSDFMPEFGGASKQQDSASILSGLNQYANAYRKSREALKRRSGKTDVK